MNGNRTSLRTRAGETIAFTFDALNRMTLKDRPNFEPDVAYGYDLRNLQTSATFTSTGQGVTNAYDAFGRLTSTTTNVGGVSRTLAFAHDPNGNRIRVTHPDGIWFDYDYDPAAPGGHVFYR